MISALGHKWDNGKITKQPTETENGIKTYTCTVCGNTKTESISLNDIKDTDDQNEDADGVGVISADGTILTDTDGDMYLVADKITNDKIFKNASVADKSSGGKYKITKITKEDDVVVSGTVTYMKPYNKNCKTANVKASIIIGGAKFKVTAIASKAFKGCKKLTKVTIKSNVKTIGASAFAGCKKLNSVKCTSKVLSKIGASAFSGDKKLTSIVLKTSKLKSKTVGKNAFKGTSKKLKISVPKGAKKKYKKFFKNKGNKKVTIK